MRVWIAGLAMLAAQTAQADAYVSYGELTCEGDRALVRFAVGRNEEAPTFPKLPDGIAPFSSPPIEGNRCDLASGTEIMAKLAPIPARPWGMCGAANRSLASLWVGGRRVLSRQMVIEPCFDVDLADLWVIENGTLTLCRSAEAIHNQIGRETEAGGPTCQTMALAEVPDDRTPATVDKPIGSVAVVQGDPGYCDRFVQNGEVPGNEIWAFDAANAMDSWNDPRRWMAGRPFRYELSLPPTYQSFVLPQGTIRPRLQFRDLGSGDRFILRKDAGDFAGQSDIDGDRRPDLVLIRSGLSGAVSGDIIYVAAPETDPDALLAALQSRLKGDPLPVGVRQYDGAVPDVSQMYDEMSIFQELVIIDGEPLIFASPETRRLRPTALIYRILSDGAEEPVCVFQRVEDTF